VCLARRGNCNAIEADGCETDLGADPRHCGACGHACSFAHATAVCAATVCSFSVCDAGYGDCNGVQADGCEADLQGDAGHCGACGHACGAGTRCDAGRCVAASLTLSLGLVHSCALLAGGDVKCWGSNFNGQLGDGTTTDHLPSTAVALGGLARAVTARANHTCAIDTVGTMRCWGYNVHRQIGIGTNTPQLTPIEPTGLGAGVTSIAAGATQTCAVAADAGVFCWGLNNVGQVGDDTNVSRGTPVPVFGLHGQGAAVFTGENHSCAILTNGSAMCWGSDWQGELGDGATANQVHPVAVVGL